MKIDPSKEPTIVRLQGAIRVTLSLSGEEGDSWAQDYNTAAERAQIDASAVQWAISVTINDIDKVADTLGSAVGLLDVANLAYSERNKSVPMMEVMANEWWKQFSGKIPPASSRVTTTQSPPGDNDIGWGVLFSEAGRPRTSRRYDHFPAAARWSTDRDHARVALTRSAMSLMYPTSWSRRWRTATSGTSGNKNKTASGMGAKGKNITGTKMASQGSGRRELKSWILLAWT